MSGQPACAIPRLKMFRPSSLVDSPDRYFACQLPMTSRRFAFASLHAIRPALSFVLVVAMLGGCSPRSGTESLGANDMALNNRGVALMGQFDYDGARLTFADLVERHPERADVRTNLAIALMNRQEPGDSDAALRHLAEVLRDNPQDVRANYVAGLLHLYVGDVEAAEERFAAALSADPEDAYTLYYLGQARLRSGDEDGALDLFEQAIELDPYLRSSYYSAAQILRRQGEDDAAAKWLATFQRFENNPVARLAEFKYSRMGPRSMAQVASDTATPGQPVRPQGAVFTQARTVASLPANGRRYLTTADVNSDGRQDLLLAGGDADAGPLLLTGTGDGYVMDDNQPWADVGAVNAAAWGDVDNDGDVDLYLCRAGANQLWLQGGDGAWRMAGEAANAGDGNRDCADVTFVDADHDGDLDILIGNRGAGDNLLSNNRDGSFRSLAERLPGATASVDTRRLLVADLDGDLDADLVFLRDAAPHLVLLNDRQWQYQPAPGMEAFTTGNWQAAATADLDADGQVEIYSLAASGELAAWQPQMGGQWQALPLHRPAVEGEADLLPMDFDGDGRVELAVIAPGAFEVVAIDASGSATTLASERHEGGRAIPVLRSLEDGYSLLAVAATPDGAVVNAWDPGPGRYGFATLLLSGKHDEAETMRSNASGIGTQLRVRIGSQWSLLDTYKHASLPGQSLQPLAIGLAGRPAADFVALHWSDGVYQTELDLPGGSLTRVGELQRQLGSCPVLFAWNGERFEFVTDLLGVAAQGFLVEPGVYLPPRPWERTTFAPGRLAGRDGRLQFKLTEPMEENTYLDTMWLDRYDLPDGWEIVVDERLGTAAPEVTGDTLFFRQAVSPARAHDASGSDVLADIARHDNKAMPVGVIDRRFIGLLKEPNSLTLEFDEPIDAMADNPDAVPVLVAESWVELPYSQTHFAAWQAGRAFRSVSLEARVADGNWQSVYPEFGIPGGMPRVMSLPLRDLPAGTVALRLSWNREIYWDRLRLAFAEAPPADMRHERRQPQLARVAKTGFSTRTTHEQRRPEYNYDNRKPFRDTLYATGFYTRLGTATELVENLDNALAIIGPGEEVHVEFELGEPPGAGLRRWYVLETRGWAKDKDLYTRLGNTVGPLPRSDINADEARREALHRQYNTRFLSGR